MKIKRKDNIKEGNTDGRMEWMDEWDGWKECKDGEKEWMKGEGIQEKVSNGTKNRHKR